MKPLSFWQRASAARDEPAATAPDGSVLATLGEVDAASRRLLDAAITGTATSATTTTTTAELLARGLVDAIGHPHREVLDGVTRPWTREMALRSWGSAVGLLAQRTGVTGGPFLIAGGLHHASLRLVASWALHAGCRLQLCDALDPAAVAGAIVTGLPSGAFLTRGLLAALAERHTGPLSTIATVLVPAAESAAIDTGLANVQPIRFRGPVPVVAGRRAPARRAWRSFWEWAADEPHRVAVRDETNGRVTTFGELATAATALARRIGELGWHPAPIVVSPAQDTTSTLVTVLAAQAGGFHWMTAARGIDPGEFVRSMANSDGGDAANSDDGDAGYRQLDGTDAWLVRRAVPTVPGRSEDEAPPAIIMRTSGSTGNGRLVVQREVSTDVDDAGASSAQLADMLGVPAGGVFAVARSLLHGSFFSVAMVALHHGNELRYFGPDREDAIAGAIERGEITAVFLLPHMLERVVDAFGRGGRIVPDPSPLASVVHGGEWITPATKAAAIELFGPVVHELYSTTEGNGTYIDSEDWLRYPGSVGWPLPGALVRVGGDGDGDGDGESKDGDEGDVYLWNDDGAFLDGSAPMTGWFLTGDRGRVDPVTGALYLTGRGPELIVCNGRKLPGRRIAGALRQHPGVTEAAVAVAPAPDGDGPERLIAYVATRDDDVDLDTVRAAASAALYKEQVPDHFVRVDALPRLDGGKIDWSALRAMAAANA